MVSNPVESPPCLLREQYVPREGDMVFFTYYKKVWKLLYKVGNSGAPYHVALVVRTPEGCLKLLEAGSLDPTDVQLADVRTRVLEYQGLVAVRSLCRPVTPEQSKQLTCFALEQLGKPFAKKRVGADALFHRKLSLLRFWKQGPPPTNREDWYCSEVVTSCLIECGLLPADMVIPHAPFPRDLYYSCPRSIDPWYCPPVELHCAPCSEPGFPTVP